MADTNPTTQPILLQIPTTVKSLVEALIFGAREPFSVRQVQALYEDLPAEGIDQRKISYEEITRIVEELNAEYTAADRPFRIVQIAGGYQFATLPEYAEWLGKLYKEQARRKLSQSSIETLAIIAYKQPITKPELEGIRGVNCDYVIKTLLEKDLATIVGRAPTVGRPLLYGTSTEFLKHFGLNDLNDLPRPREIQEILGESQFETERRMLEAQQGIGEKKEEDFKSRLPHIPKRKAGFDDEVKIIQRKRTREIKVRPSDESITATPGATPEETKERVPLSTVPETSVVPPVEDEIIAQEQRIEAEESVIPGIEKSSVQENLATDAPVEESETPPTDDDRGGYVGLTKVPFGESEAVSELTVEIKEMPTEEIVPSSDGMKEGIIPEEFLEEPVVESLANAAAAEEQSAEIAEQEEKHPFKAEVAEETLSAAELTDAHINQLTPQSVSPTVEENSSTVAGVGREVLQPEITDQLNVPHPKSRWKSWKDKIQGFIKKLFG